MSLGEAAAVADLAGTATGRGAKSGARGEGGWTLRRLLRRSTKENNDTKRNEKTS